MNGEICFDSYYDLENNQFYSNSNEYVGDKKSKYHLQDCYKVEIKRDNLSGEFFAFETNARIEKFAEENNISTISLHINSGGGDFCVAPKNTDLYRYNSKNKNLFLNKLLIPFLFSHTFFEKHKERPWLDYSHGDIGNLEAYYRENAIDSKERVVRNLLYLKSIKFPIKNLIGNNPKFLKGINKQSKEAFLGVEKLIKDIKTFNLEKYLK